VQLNAKEGMITGILLKKQCKNGIIKDIDKTTRHKVFCFNQT